MVKSDRFSKCPSLSKKIAFVRSSLENAIGNLTTYRHNTKNHSLKKPATKPVLLFPWKNLLDRWLHVKRIFSPTLGPIWTTKRSYSGTMGKTCPLKLPNQISIVYPYMNCTIFQWSTWPVIWCRVWRWNGKNWIFFVPSLPLQVCC